jgi:cell division protein FtsW
MTMATQRVAAAPRLTSTAVGALASLGRPATRAWRRGATRARGERAVPVVAYTADRWIMGAVAVLIALGVVMVLNTSYFFAVDRYGDPFYLVRKHVVAILLGALCCIVASRVGSRRWESLAYPLLALAVLVLIAVLLPGIGIVRGGARRWIAAGPLNLQPSELAKVAAVLYLARSLVRKRPQIESFTLGVLPHAIMIGLMAALVVREPDFGAAAVLAAVLVAMLFAAGARWWHLALPALAVLPLAAWAVWTSAYRLERVLTFLDPWENPRDAGFQLVQSFVAFGSGGLTGAGLGESKQKMFYLPEAHTDFIFSVVGEELGLVGAVAVLALFTVIAVRGFRIAFRHPDDFGSLLAFGLTVLLVLQAGINMAVVLGLLPTKGLALPFVSYGGSAMLAAMASVGILLALSRESG